MNPRHRLTEAVSGFRTSCKAVATADRGEPGYWSKLDADRDGIACEPFPR
ncbi:excalibur calcium-binding domain-containing protein [Roseibium aggregatum]